SVADAASAAVSVGARSASVDISRLSLFGGEITADALAAHADSGSTDPFAGSALTNLVVLGTSVAAASNTRLQLGGWGHMVVLEQEATPAKDALIALDIFVDSDHAGLPAGSRILVGDAEAWTRQQRVPLVTPRRAAPTAGPSGSKGPNRV